MFWGGGLSFWNTPILEASWNALRLHCHHQNDVQRLHFLRGLIWAWLSLLYEATWEPWGRCVEVSWIWFFLVILGNSLQKTLASYPKTTNPLSSNVDVDGISDRPMAFFSSTSLGDFTDVSAVRIWGGIPQLERVHTIPWSFDKVWSCVWWLLRYRFIMIDDRSWQLGPFSCKSLFHTCVPLSLGCCFMLFLIGLRLEFTLRLLYESFISMECSDVLSFH